MCNRTVGDLFRASITNIRSLVQSFATFLFKILAGLITGRASYDEVVDQGKEEVNRGYKPEIKPLDVDIKDYDVIAVGTPTWWYTMAPAVLTFLSSHDWSGKKVIPFMTNGGWPGHVIEDMMKECKGAEIVKPMEIRFDSQGGPVLKTPEDKINEWIAEIKSNL